ncbi:MAG: GNAT family N-acetyltransferase [Lachnospiraceae bacterium]|nr:GNAT family N-acetyltransferase [Lachnospiraceae bacterium]
MEYRQIRKEDDAALAGIIRKNLEAHGLDIPGTAYFDETLDHLSAFYLADRTKRFYYIVTENGKVLGGVGLAELDFFEDCAELQKLYLTDAAKGKGIAYKLIGLLEDKARELGYRSVYLETHHNLQAAIHIYGKCGYREIEKPKSVVHTTMDRFFLKQL